jgi:hypothetical protein
MNAPRLEVAMPLMPRYALALTLALAGCKQPANQAAAVKDDEPPVEEGGTVEGGDPGNDTDPQSPSPYGAGGGANRQADNCLCTFRCNGVLETYRNQDCTATDRTCYARTYDNSSRNTACWQAAAKLCEGKGRRADLADCQPKP